MPVPPSVFMSGAGVDLALFHGRHEYLNVNMRKIYLVTRWRSSHGQPIVVHGPLAPTVCFGHK